jgi:hypothetical protein
VVTNPRLPSRIRQGLNVESSLNDGVCVPLLIIFLTVAQAEEAIGHVEAVKVVLEEIGIVAADQAEDATFLGWFGPRGLAWIVFVLILLADTRARGAVRRGDPAQVLHDVVYRLPGGGKGAAKVEQELLKLAQLPPARPSQRTARRRRRLCHLVCPHSLPCQRPGGVGGIDRARAPADSCTSPTLLMGGSLPGTAAGALPYAR